MSDVEAMDRLASLLLDELLGSSSLFFRSMRRLSTARLQEMRRAVDTELAQRMQPALDLRDGKAGRS